MIDEPAAWLALLRAPGIGTTRIHKLIAYFGSPQAALNGTVTEFTDLGLPQAAQNYIRSPDWQQIEKDLVWLAKPDNRLLTPFDGDYPQLLREIGQPPPLLFVHGDVSVLQEPQIAMVGTRQPSASGQQLARDFAAHLAGFGIVITSGLALGIDAASHHGALAAVKGRTIAVMGTGLDRVYPARHRDLARAIVAQGGALVSEFLPGTPALAEHFPRRNRIISGLSLGTLVVEAALQSGSLITARLAAEQGREVFAIPGSVHNPVARGCHSLIKQGAKLVETATDILEELGPLAAVVVSVKTKTPEGSRRHAEGDLLAEQNKNTANGVLSKQNTEDNLKDDLNPENLDSEYRQLLGFLNDRPVAVDMLVEQSGLTVESVSSMLLILELQGYITAVPGGLFSRVKSEDG